MSKRAKHPLPPSEHEPPKSPLRPIADEATPTTKKPNGPPDTGGEGNEG